MEIEPRTQPFNTINTTMPFMLCADHVYPIQDTRKVFHTVEAAIREMDKMGATWFYERIAIYDVRDRPPHLRLLWERPEY